MKRIFSLQTLSLILILPFACAVPKASIDNQLKNKRVLFLGNSITHNGLYVSMIEYALQKTDPNQSTNIISIGLASETVSCLTENDHPFPRPCLLERLDRALEEIKPDIVVACYGINDGIYHPLNAARTQTFQDGIKTLIQKTKETGIELILLTPPPFDALPIPEKVRGNDFHDFGYKHPFRDYDNVLKNYSKWLMSLATPDLKVIDWHTAINQNLAEKRKKTPNFTYAKDGIHPNEAGHLLMANITLKGLGFEESTQFLSDWKNLNGNIIFQEVHQSRMERSERWLAYIGYTRGKTVKSNSPNSLLLSSQLTVLPAYSGITASEDWLIKSPKTKAKVYRNGNKELVISNGLVSRTFRIAPNVATISLKNEISEEEYIRSVKPEALILLDSVEYAIGGLKGQKEHGYLLPQWLDEMTIDSTAFNYQRIEIKDLEERFSWKKSRWIPSSQWKAKGKEIVFHYQHSAPKLHGITIKVHYELYDNIPLISKWLSVENKGNKKVKINHFTSEIIAHPEKNNFVDIPTQWAYPNLYFENDFAFSGFTYEESEKALTWEADPDYSSQVNWEKKMPCVIKSQPKIGPQITIANGENFESFRTYLLTLDGTDRERNSLSKRKMYRTIAPWVTENPIFMHLTSTDPTAVKRAIDQCAETGYEMVILSFGSGLNMEDTKAINIEKFKTLVDYAHAKNIQLGGYSLFSSRKIDDKTDVIDIKTNKPGGAKFGNAPCGGSQWGIDYIKKLKNFISQTGFDILEHDGPYPGDFCASTTHPGHHNYFDSQWAQWKQATDFYKWIRSKGIYTNIPDIYLLSGSNKVGIGYREVNWSLPRAQQILLGRQNIYDGTWSRTPSMGWTFVPLTEYHGGGEAATLEPLSEHLDSYAAHMTQNYKSGVQACYRGPRLYDTETTKALVKSNIDHYLQYREILNADIIHLRRPDGRDWDGILHADPNLKNKGYAVLYNPLPKVIRRTIQLPLYYTGLTNKAQISINGGDFKEYDLDRKYRVELEVKIEAKGHVWVVVQ